MALGVRDKKQLRNFLLNKQRLSFNPSKTLMTYLENDYGDFFRIKGVSVNFTEDDKQRFRQEVTRGIPDLFAKIGEHRDRVEASEYLTDEKQSAISPEQSHVTLAHHEGLFSVAGLSEALPIGVSIRVAINSLHLDKIDTLVVIENLSAFDHWYKVNWSSVTPNTYAVYRGHDRLNKGINSLIAKVAPHAQIVAFCDYDPKGIEIALTTEHMQALLIPELTSSFLAKFNRPELYSKQNSSLVFLKRQLSNHPHTLLQLLLNDLKPVSVMQEHMLAHNIPMHSVSMT